MQFQSAFDKPGPDNFSFVRNVHEKVRDMASGLPKIRGT